ncbi:hypothetical protein CHS0354_023812 [Potamilus streckersoni]|uniref:Uncharacterized protein n=1 Tax=Potamilus streckersoni TaxID=2493646 RepID=A0AAE0RZ71_9BIVA|nr:hypothetical protein CHS0354_023812 [Potamilus streckersoni]
MFWTEEIKEQVDKYFSDISNPTSIVINDSKTPSDDYDPVDEIPKDQNTHFEKYLGQPLCNVPAPPNSSHPDMATHFISNFFNIFSKTDINPTRYRMRDIYRSGQFDEAIEAILQSTPIIRNIYKAVSGSEKSDSWFPFQPICEACGRIGTTLTTNFDGKEVTYSCEPNIVKWAKGCGYKGKVSPFSGNGKLPWKLEWVAKWKTFNIILEGAGMDHTTKGGSHDVASAILKKFFLSNPLSAFPTDSSYLTDLK